MTISKAPTKPIRLLLVDDHPVMRAGLANLLSMNRDFSVVGEVDDGETALRIWKQVLPDVCLLDVSMQGIDGIETLRRIRALDPGARVLMLTSSEAAEDVQYALEAGAALDDALAATPLVEMAKSSTTDNRIRAIGLLARFGFNPDINLGLRPLLNDSDPDIRLAAYETLLKRKDPAIRVMDIDDKFDVVLIPSDKRMIYITQSGRPTVALFGDDTAVGRPLTHSTWGNRLMFKADQNDDDLQIFYRPADEARPEIQLVDRHLSELLPFLGHTVTVEKPLPGIGLSYGETIGAIHSLWRAGHIDADFKAEQDRIQAAILRRQSQEDEANRPEFEPEPEGDPTQPSAAPSDLSGLEPPPAVEVPGKSRDTVPR